MSDTVKLIIKISEDVYTRLFDNGIQDNEIAVDDVCEMARALRIGTPLDDITTVIRNKYDSIPWRYNDNDDGWIEALEWSLDVIENILSKAESEDKE